MINIAIFASGTGSNARKIVEYFVDHPEINVVLIVSNKKTAKVLDLSLEYQLSTLVIDRSYFYESKDLLNVLKAESVEFIALAGFLWLIPPYLIDAFPSHIVNIHPALLPKYGGKGMYGMNVHRAVKQNKEVESGPTIHLVNAEYDKGEVLFQTKCPLQEEDSPETIASKVLALEHEHFAPTLEDFIKSKK